MNPRWLWKNVRTAWRFRAGVGDFAKRLLLAYSTGLPEGGREFEIGFRYGAPAGAVRLRLRANRGADYFIHSEVFEHRYYALPMGKKPRAILDLGANIGLTAVWFGREYPQAEIVCVEPMPANARVLRRNIELNDIRAKVFQAAIDVTDGPQEMSVEPKDYGHRILERGDASRSSSSTRLSVEAISVPTIMAQMDWEAIDLVKMDIEGHEKVLLSSHAEWVHQVNALCIEWHHPNPAGELCALANRYGFLPPRELPGIWLLERERWR